MKDKTLRKFLLAHLEISVAKYLGTVSSRSHFTVAGLECVFFFRAFDEILCIFGPMFDFHDPP